MKGFLNEYESPYIFLWHFQGVSWSVWVGQAPSIIFHTVSLDIAANSSSWSFHCAHNGFGEHWRWPWSASRIPVMWRSRGGRRGGCRWGRGRTGEVCVNSTAASSSSAPGVSARAERRRRRSWRRRKRRNTSEQDTFDVADDILQCQSK